MKFAHVLVLIAALIAGGAAAFLIAGGVDKQTALGPVVQLPAVDVRIVTGGVNSSSDREAEINTIWFGASANT